MYQALFSQEYEWIADFHSGMLREDARAKDFEVALQWLADCGLIHQVHRVSKLGMPLKAYHDLTAFKLYLLDVGLLATMGDIDVRTLLGGNDIYTEFKGARRSSMLSRSLPSSPSLSPGLRLCPYSGRWDTLSMTIILHRFLPDLSLSFSHHRWLNYYVLPALVLSTCIFKLCLKGCIHVAFFGILKAIVMVK